MTEIATTQAATTPGRKGLLARAIGVVISPRSTYGDISSRPRVLGALALTVAIIVTGTALFVNSEVGRQAVLDQQVQQREAFGRPMTDAQYEAIERFAPYFAYLTAASQIVFVPLLALVVAAISYALFTAILGGDALFKQVFAAVAHSGFVLALAQFFVLPLDYVRESLTSPTNLHVFLPFIEDNTLPARLLGSIDLVYVWWMVNLAIGLGVLYRRRTGPIAIGILAIYFVIALAVAVVRSALAGA